MRASHQLVGTERCLELLFPDENSRPGLRTFREWQARGTSPTTRSVAGPSSTRRRSAPPWIAGSRSTPLRPEENAVRSRCRTGGDVPTTLRARTMELRLCRERLERLLKVLRSLGGLATVRDLQRTHAIWWWEVEEAAKLNWISISIRRGQRGRSSHIAEIVSKHPPAKLPPPRNEIERSIKFRHRLFAIQSVDVTDSASLYSLRLISKTEAYLRVYPRCRRRGAAATGASRLMKRLDVRWMRLWLFCNAEGRVGGEMPQSVTELRRHLEAAGVTIRCLPSRSR